MRCDAVPSMGGDSLIARRNIVVGGDINSPSNVVFGLFAVIFDRIFKTNAIAPIHPPEFLDDRGIWGTVAGVGLYPTAAAIP